jgi:hypothetical protein
MDDSPATRRGSSVLQRLMQDAGLVRAVYKDFCVFLWVDVRRRQVAATLVGENPSQQVDGASTESWATSQRFEERRDTGGAGIVFGIRDHVVPVSVPYTCRPPSSTARDAPEGGRTSDRAHRAEASAPAGSALATSP